MKTDISNIIQKSGLNFLKNIEFEEITKGRYFQKEKINLGNSLKQFYVILAPNIESPIHTHKGQNIEETHLLLYGSGKFIIYDLHNNPEHEIVLFKGQFHKIFSAPEFTPLHKYVAGSEGSITLALEKNYLHSSRKE